MTTSSNHADESSRDVQSQESSAGTQDQSQRGSSKDRAPLSNPPQSPNDRDDRSERNSEIEGNKPQRGQDEKVGDEEDEEQRGRMNQGKKDDVP